MRKSRIMAILVVLLVCVFTLNTVNAVDIFDSQTTTEVYKLSEDTSSFNLPFFRLSEERMELDKEISQLGFFFSNSSVDVNSSLDKAQIIFANDAVRINADMEYAIVMSATNVTVSANVKNLIVYAGSALTIEEGGNVSENLIVYTPSMTVNGNIDGNVLGTATDVTINSVVNGEVRLSTNSVTFGDSALLLSGININTTNAELTVPEEVGTSTIDVTEEETTTVKEYCMNILLALIRDLVAFALILILFKKDNVEKIVSNIEAKGILKNGVITYLVGIACICFGFVLAVYLLPKIGGAAMIFGIALLLIFTLVKNVIVGTFVAFLTSNKYKESNVKPNAILTAIASFLMIELVETIPYLGQVLKFIIFLFAAGVVVSLLVRKEQKVEKVENKEEVIEAK